MAPPVRFVVVFLVALAVLAVVYPWFSTRFNDMMVAFMSLTARITAALLNLTGTHVTVSGRVITAGGISVEVIEECTGAYEIIIFWAAVIAFPARWRAKAWGIIGGMIALLAINVIRIAFLVAVGNRWPSLFHFLHIYFWQATLILMIVVVWMAWIRLFTGRYDPRAGTNNAAHPHRVCS